MGQGAPTAPATTEASAQRLNPAGDLGGGVGNLVSL